MSEHNEEVEDVIVVGVDGSDASLAALDWAAGQAVLTGVTLHAIRAWHVPMGFYGYAVPEAIRRDAQADCQTVLDGAVDRCLAAHPGLRAKTQVVDNSPALALLDAALHARLLVVGSHGHGAFAGMVLGSVSQHCVGHAACPVLVVRAEVAR